MDIKLPSKILPILFHIEIAMVGFASVLFEMSLLAQTACILDMPTQTVVLPEFSAVVRPVHRFAYMEAMLFGMMAPRNNDFGITTISQLISGRPTKEEQTVFTLQQHRTHTSRPPATSTGEIVQTLI